MLENMVELKLGVNLKCICELRIDTLLIHVQGVCWYQRIRLLLISVLEWLNEKDSGMCFAELAEAIE